MPLISRFKLWENNKVIIKLKTKIVCVTILLNYYVKTYLKYLTLTPVYQVNLIIYLKRLT